MNLQSVVAGLGDWSTGQGPLYQRLADSLRNSIRHGVLGAGSRLPSERDLARSLGTSRTTIIAAYRLLRDDGLLESTRGSGTRVTASGSGVGPAVPLLLGGTATAVTHSRGLRGGLGRGGVDGRAHLPHAARPAVGGGADFELGAEPGDEYEAGGVVLGGEFAAAGAAGTSGGHFTGGAVELGNDAAGLSSWDTSQKLSLGTLCESCFARGCENEDQRQTGHGPVRVRGLSKLLISASAKRDPFTKAHHAAVVGPSSIWSPPASGSPKFENALATAQADQGPRPALPRHPDGVRDETAGPRRRWTYRARRRLQRPQRGPADVRRTARRDPRPGRTPAGRLCQAEEMMMKEVA
ncbi:GntR family transcriptional regulator [Streptomyces hygroscopicus]|nr:GntR family transcriptional regulator [Streptomyces hygroscopicus]